ncbi:restriction endonuclease subunit S [Streptococcus salivarius]|uniref:restriction endonuclease subunit S n=1 Tax=Streptococcus salivarius TaxID=1304 RepID=UPI001918BD52|nr:restriction endonuclease subunit S [Streptococcus salivarius]
MLKYITPRIRFQEFDFWWETIKLTDLGISVGGTAIESEFDPDGKYKVISIGSYSEESKYKDQGIRAIYSKKTEKRILEKDDLTMILNDKTSTGKIIGRVLLIDEDNSYVYNQRTQRICLDKNKYVPDFIFQLLNADINRNKIVRSAQGNTQIYVNWSDISNLDYLIPESIEEQSAIGSLFLTLDDLLASYKDNLANYQSLKATMLSKMFPKAGQTVPGIRLDGFEGEWEVQTLKELASFSKGNGYTKNDLVNSGEEIILYGRLYTNYQTVISKVNTFVTTVKANAVISKGGEVIVPASGESAEDISRASVVEKSGVILGGDLNIIYPDENKVDSIFLALTISNGSQQKELIKRAQGKSVVHLRNNDLEKVVLHYPSMEEQQAIGTYFSNLDNLIAAHQEKIYQLETLKKKLLQDMFI